MSDILIIFFGMTMLYVFAASRIEAFIKALAFQGLMLFLLVLLDIHEISWLNFSFLVLETLVVKTLLIPGFLLRVIRRNEIGREVEPYISQFYSLLIASLIFMSSFVIAFWAANVEPGIKSIYFGISIAMMVASLFLIVTRKRIITHILGFMMFENGIFLLSLSVADEMPLLINLGVLLDLFVGVYLLGVFFNKIEMIFNADHIDALTQLKD